MGNILNDIVEEVNIKPNKTKLVLKWGISIAGSLITIAFVFGQFKASFFNRMDKFEATITENTVAIEELRNEMNVDFEEVNARIDKGYDDNLTALQDYQEFNKKQLLLVLDYGQTNKNLLKEMLEINMQEKTKTVENQMMSAKNETTKVETPKQIGVKRYMPESKNYISFHYNVDKISGDTIFYLVGANKEFINKIDRKRYEVGAMIENNEYPNLFDVNYRNK